MLASSTLAYDELIVGLASVVGSSIIILTYVLFPNLRKLRYVELVFYVAVNDLVASIGLALGPVPNDSFECWFQGLSSTINFISSAFWTTVILYQVYLVVIKNGRVLKDMFWIHVFCWGWPVVLAILPLSTNTYNNPDDESTWCFVANTRHSPPWGELFWVLFTFFVWVWLCMIINCVQIVRIVLKLRNMQVVSHVVQSTVNKLIFYPVITILCWTLNTAANVYVFTSGASFNNLSPAWDAVSTVGIILAAAQGVFNAAVFIGMNTIVREHWAELLYRLYRLLVHCTVDKDRPALRTASRSVDVDTTHLSDSATTAAALKAAAAAAGITTTTDNILHKQAMNVSRINKLEHAERRTDNRETEKETEIETDDDYRTGPLSQANLFRDTAISDAGLGVRLSSYLSVALPVDEELDFIGADLRTSTAEVETDNMFSRASSIFGGYHARQSGAQAAPRQSSIFGYFRNSTAENTATGRQSSVFGIFRNSTARGLAGAHAGTSATLDQVVGEL